MLFNSIEFAIFLPVVFLLYWFVFKKREHQNILLLMSSYIFYGWWDWRFLSLIIVSSLVDYYIGLKLYQSKKNRKWLLSISIFVNLGFLVFFKYYNFFADSFANAFTFFGHPLSIERLNIILPVGISFYTFQTMSYTIDIYRKKLTPNRNIISFFAFVSFFPQLVAGPIERAANLLPQFDSNRNFHYPEAINGLRQILWGLFKKMVVADNCAHFVDRAFDNPELFSSPTLIIGVVLFSFQIYCDFSGYSDIAIGTAKLFGFTLMQNFAFPYFSRDIAEFWRRWHISLSTWFRDYLYIPLGGSRVDKPLVIRNTLIIFIVSGFWHGANWTFIIWGAIHAFLFLPLILLQRNRKNIRFSKTHRIQISSLFSRLLTFVLVSFTWIFFRADNLDRAIRYISHMFQNGITNYGSVFIKTSYIIYPFFILIMLLFEWHNRYEHHGLTLKNINHGWQRKLIYVFIAWLIFFFSGNTQSFIYFQF